MKYSALILAAGSGSRMKLGYNKVYALLKNGKTILETTMDVFLQDEDCAQIVVQTDCVEYFDRVLGRKSGKVVVVKGGQTRQESVANGLGAILCDYVLIHDGARPFLTMDALNRLKKALETNDAAILGVKAKDTIKQVDGEYIAKTLDRDVLIQAQTPQGFKTDLMISCMNQAVKEGFLGTDDASLIERYSDVKVKVVEGDYRNIKITTIEDL